MPPVGLTTAFEIAGAAGVVLAALTLAAGAARIGSRLALGILAAVISAGAVVAWVYVALRQERVLAVSAGLGAACAAFSVVDALHNG